MKLRVTLGCCCVAAAAAAAQVSRTIGIDIDEAHVRVGVLRNGKVEVLRNDQGVELTPSYVAFTSSGRRLIGDEAKIQLTTNPQNTLFSVLLLMGRRFDDVIVQNHIRRMPYRVYSRNGKPVIEVQVGDRDETFAPEEIVAMLLRKMKEIAELYVNEAVTAAVVSTPSCFSYLQIQAMRAAGTMAGLNETFIVSASVAAGVASAKAGEGAGERTQLLLGVGHSCAEAAVISITDHPAAVQVEAQASLRDVGVEQLQRRVMKHVLEQIEQKAGQSVAEKWKQSLASQKLCREVEMGVRSLATKDTAHIQTESLSDGLNCSETLTQSRFDALSADLAAKILYLAINTAKSADKQAGDIHGVILLGSASRASAIRRAVGTAFNRTEIMDDGFLDPDKASVIGAAIYAGHLDGTTSASAGLAVLTVNARTFGYMTATDKFVPMLHPNDIVPNKYDGPAGVDSSGQEVTHIALLVYEAAGDGAQNQEYIGNLTIDLPPTLSTDVWITFQMEKFHKLQVTLDEMKTGASKNITFEHGISAWQLQKARRRLKGLAKADRQELSRQQARDGLESLAYGCLRRVKRPANSETSTVPREAETEDRALAEAEALGAIDWLEANRGAEVAELATKTRALELALAKISSPC